MLNTSRNGPHRLQSADQKQAQRRQLPTTVYTPDTAIIKTQSLVTQKSRQNIKLRKHASDSERRNKIKPIQELVDSQKGALHKFFSKREEEPLDCDGLEIEEDNIEHSNEKFTNDNPLNDDTTNVNYEHDNLLDESNVDIGIDEIKGIFEIRTLIFNLTHTLIIDPKSKSLISYSFQSPFTFSSRRSDRFHRRRYSATVLPLSPSSSLPQRNGFQRLDKMKDSTRQSKQLEELTGKIRECKRLIKEFEREIKDEESKNPPEVNKQLNDEKQSMIKELN
ncbi:hypothetical protein V6N11_044789 [Hibiscus sabdariffa]|uniref:Uncharacterized protein n=1 Tax=Hibiscus sabdariffa TaxID=183260 RepID=A0ABR2PUJ6_9ROSI